MTRLVVMALALFMASCGGAGPVKDARRNNDAAPVLHNQAQASPRYRSMLITEDSNPELYNAIKNNEFTKISSLLGNPGEYSSRTAINSKGEPAIKIYITDSSSAASPGHDDTTETGDHECPEIRARGLEGSVPVYRNSEGMARKDTKALASDYKLGNDTPATLAVLNRDFEALRSLPAEEFSLIQARDASGVLSTPLHLAVEQGDIGILEALSRRKVNWNAADQYGRTPLHLAVMGGSRAAVQLLLSSGADPNLPDLSHGGNAGPTPFSLAISREPGLAELMMKQGKIPEGRAALEAAVWAENLELIRKLLPCQEPDFETSRAVRLAANMDIAKYIARNALGDDRSAFVLTDDTLDAKNAYETFENDPPLHERTAPTDTDVSRKRGRFMHKVKAGKTDVSMYVPGQYDGSEPYGIIVFLHGPRKTHSYPSREYQKVLDKHNVIWAGYSAYDESSYGFALSTLHEVRRHFDIDPKRTYISGFSYGGGISARMINLYPRLFSGAMVMSASCDMGLAPGLRYAKKHAGLIIGAGDLDSNRTGAFESYAQCLLAGYRNIHYLQNQGKVHEILSPENLDKALSLLQK